MKFIASSSTLLKHLNMVIGVVPPNPLVPILENFLFEITKDKLTIYASDVQISMITEMPIECKEVGSIAVPAKILIDTIKNLPDQPITFSIDTDKFSVEISSDNGRYKLTGENATDFPKAPALSKASKIDIASDTLNQAIAYTLFATATDELKPAMNGVLIAISDSNTTFVSTDGHRLCRYRRVDVISAEAQKILVPRKALSLLKGCLPSANALVNIEYNLENAFFSFNNLQLICRLIDERFPDYENAIPLTNPNKLSIERNELLSCLKRISIYANKSTHQVRFKLSGSELHVSAEDLDFSNEANERLACEFQGEDMEIGFNAKLVIEMLANIPANRIEISMSTPNKPGIISTNESETSEDLLMLVMPVTLNSYS